MGYEADRSGPAGRDLGRAIKQTREARGITRGTLSDTAALSYSYLAEIENGAKQPSQRVLHAIAVALGLSQSELLAVAERLAVEPEAPPGTGPTDAFAAYEATRASLGAELGARERQVGWFRGRERATSARMLQEPVVPTVAESRTPELGYELMRLTEVMESFKKRLSGVDATIDQLRADQRAAAVERDEIGNRISRWQERMDKRLTELTEKVARLTERHSVLSERLEDSEPE